MSTEIEHAFRTGFAAGAERLSPDASGWSEDEAWSLYQEVVLGKQATEDRTKPPPGWQVMPRALPHGWGGFYPGVHDLFEGVGYRGCFPTKDAAVANAWKTVDEDREAGSTTSP